MKFLEADPREMRRMVREASDRLATIAFIDRAETDATSEEREAAWSMFYGQCPKDLAYLVKAADSLVDWIVAAAALATQIRDKSGQASCEEREVAIGELADFLEGKARLLSPSTGEERSPLKDQEQTLVVDIPGNEWLSANHRHTPRVKASRVAALRLRAGMLARSHSLRPMTGLVRITAVIHARAARRFDPNNIADTTKPLVDGLCDAGVLVDDDSRHVIGPNHLHGAPMPDLPVGFHRIVLTLSPVERADRGLR